MSVKLWCWEVVPYMVVNHGNVAINFVFNFPKPSIEAWVGHKPNCIRGALSALQSVLSHVFHSHQLGRCGTLLPIGSTFWRHNLRALWLHQETNKFIAPGFIGLLSYTLFVFPNADGGIVGWSDKTKRIFFLCHFNSLYTTLRTQRYIKNSSTFLAWFVILTKRSIVDKRTFKMAKKRKKPSDYFQAICNPNL